MTTVRFLYDGDLPRGIEIKGHSSRNAGDTEGKILCSAVSSASYMTVNTLTDVLHEDCDIDVSDGYLFLKVNHPGTEATALLRGLFLHLEQLGADYPENIRTLTEV